MTTIDKVALMEQAERSFKECLLSVFKIPCRSCGVI